MKRFTKPQRKGGGIQHFWSPATASPINRIIKADGVYIWDEFGNKLFDASSGPVVCNLGHRNPEILSAMRAQAEKVTFAYPSMFRSDANEQLGDVLIDLAGPGYDRAYFVSGGSEAVEIAFKFARQYALATGKPNKNKIIGRMPSYHGSTFGAMSVTGDTWLSAIFGQMYKQMPMIPAPLSYRAKPGVTQEQLADECADSLMLEIERQDPDTVLAFILEPIMGISGGASFATTSYYEKVRKICDHYSVLLIYDEVMSGAGRSGTFLAAHHWPTVQPDLVVMGKGLGAGYFPLGALLAPNKMVDAVVAEGGFTVGHTYKTNPLSCAVGNAVLQEIVRNDLLQQSIRLGEKLRSGLRQLQKLHQCIGDVRGKGLLIAIEIVSCRNSKKPFPYKFDAPSKIAALARNHGLSFYVRRSCESIFGEWLMITPPLTSSSQNIDELVEKLNRTFEDFHSIEVQFKKELCKS